MRTKYQENPRLRLFGELFAIPLEDDRPDDGMYSEFMVGLFSKLIHTFVTSHQVKSITSVLLSKSQELERKYFMEAFEKTFSSLYFEERKTYDKAEAELMAVEARRDSGTHLWYVNTPFLFDSDEML